MSADLHTLTGAYAVDALEPAERAQFEQHLAGCDPCAEEVRELSATAAWLGAGVAVTPPAELRRRVLAEVAQVRQRPPLPAPTRPRDGQAPPTAPTAAAGPAPARPWFRSGWGLAAAVLLAVSVGLGGVVAVQQRRLDAAEARAQAIAAVAADPDRTENSAATSTGGTVSVVAADGRAVFAARDLAALPAGRAYQLWVMEDGRPRSAGLLTVEDGAASAWVPGLGSGEALAVSVEPAAGSEQPTTDPIVVLPVA